MRQRPSWFNFGTVDVAHNRELWCSQVQFTPDVPKYFNPIFNVFPPIPVLGADSPPVGLGFCVQLTKALIDFQPSNTITLPAELSPPLKKQRFALQFRVCGAIECPSSKDIDGIPVQGPSQPSTNDKGPLPPVVLRGPLNCFCLDIFVIGHFERALIAGQESIIGKVDDMDIVDIKPDTLEANIICYVKTAVSVVLREKLTFPLSTLGLSFPLFGLATVTLTPTPNPPIPNNPAVEEDQLKIFITMKVI
jgi:hypothetical protein